MSHCNLQRNAFVGCEETRGSAFFSDSKEPVFCPRPRRVGILSTNPPRSSRLQMSSLQSEVCESKAGADILDIILMKEGYQEEQLAAPHISSPPYFCGSPPSRAANPLVQDARFGDDRLVPFQVLPSPTQGFSSPSSSARKGGCVRMKFGLKPATVRVEGFDCLNRDRQNSSIPAMA